MRALNTELQRKAEKELNEKPERIQEDIQAIKEWIEKEPHLNARTDDQWIVAFLRGCKFSLQRTKEKMDYYYTMRTLLPEFYANRDPFSPDIQAILQRGNILPLPKTKDMAGPRIVLFWWHKCFPDEISLETIIKVYFMIMDILLVEDDNFIVAGNDIFADYKEFKLNYMLQFTPGLLKKALLCLQNALPVRIKGLYIFNAPSVFESAYNLIKSFLSEKLQKRMGLYSEQNMRKVYKHIPQSLLPKEYGGSNGSIEELTAEWKKKVESYKDWFLDDAKYCTYEHLRRGKPHTTADVFGTEGTWRKLAID